MLRMTSISKRFGSIQALDAVSLSAERGEVHALVGENGAGKSTLVKILAGVHQPDGGTIEVEGVERRFRNPREAHAAGIALIHQELNLVPQLPVHENVFLGREPTRGIGLVDFRAMRRESEELLGRLGVSIDVERPVEELSVGVRQLVEIARVLSMDASILIMDEPTSALTETEVRRLFDVIRTLLGQGKLVLYISHKLDEIFAIADWVTVLRDGKVVDTARARELDEDGLIRRMVGREITEHFPKHRSRGGEVVLRAARLRAVERSSRREILRDVRIELREGEIQGVAGLMGSGRSALLRTLYGASGLEVEGEIRMLGGARLPRSPAEAMRRGVALVTEDRRRFGIFPNLDVAANVTIAHLRELLGRFLLSARRERATVSRLLGELRIQPNDPSEAIVRLSGGNQQKVIVGRCLSVPPRILLLDDPTRGIDVGAKVEIYRLMNRLASEGMAILMASSELLELLFLCDRILVLREGAMTGVLERGVATEEAILRLATVGG